MCAQYNYTGREKPKADVTTYDKNFMDDKMQGFESREQHFLNMLPVFIQDEVAKLPKENFEFSEDELRLYCFPPPRNRYDLRGEPDSRSVSARSAIWRAFDSALATGAKKIDVLAAIHGIFGIGHFANKFIKDPRRLTWILYCPADYRQVMSELLDLGLSQMLAIMSLPNTYIDERSQQPKVNAKLLDVKMRIMQHADLRLKGAIVQRIDQRTLQWNLDAGKCNPGALEVPQMEKPVDEILSLEEIDCRMAELRRRSIALTTPQNIDVDLLSPPALDREKVAAELEK